MTSVTPQPASTRSGSPQPACTTPGGQAPVDAMAAGGMPAGAVPAGGMPAGGMGAPAGVPPQYAYTYAEPDRITAFFSRLSRRSPAWVGPLLVAGGCAAAAGYVLWSDPTDGGAGEVPSCLVKLTTGFDCPGCGGTRAFWFLLRGDLGAAAQHHLLFVFAAPFLLYAYLAWAAGVLAGRRLPQLRLSFRAVGIAVGVWAAFSVLRNLPFEPFSLFYV